MGLNLNADFELFVKGKKSYTEYKGKSILMLGKQVANFSAAQFYEVMERTGFEFREEVFFERIDDLDKPIDSYDLFAIIGFDEVHALDINDYEGADIVLDLASDDIPTELFARFDYILNGGTLEHIYNVVKAMINIDLMLKKGGVVLHIVPCNGWCDHGFYSFSPTMFLDYYNSNGYSVTSIFMFCYKYPELNELPFISPDCRFINCDLWTKEHGDGYRINLICEARKEKVTDVQGLSFGFTQYVWKQMLEYDFESRINRIRELCRTLKEPRIAIYGCKETAKHFMSCIIEKELENYVVGVCDYNHVKGEKWIYDGEGNLPFLDINSLDENGINIIFCAGGSPITVSIIKRRLALHDNNTLIVV